MYKLKVSFSWQKEAIEGILSSKVGIWHDVKSQGNNLPGALKLNLA